MSTCINSTNCIFLCMLYFFISISIITSTIPQCGRWTACVSYAIFLVVFLSAFFIFFSSTQLSTCFVLILTFLIHFIYFPVLFCFDDQKSMGSRPVLGLCFSKAVHVHAKIMWVNTAVCHLKKSFINTWDILKGREEIMWLCLIARYKHS